MDCFLFECYKKHKEETITEEEGYYLKYINIDNNKSDNENKLWLKTKFKPELLLQRVIYFDCDGVEFKGANDYIGYNKSNNIIYDFMDNRFSKELGCKYIINNNYFIEIENRFSSDYNYMKSITNENIYKYLLVPNSKRKRKRNFDLNKYNGNFSRRYLNHKLILIIVYEKNKNDYYMIELDYINNNIKYEPKTIYNYKNKYNLLYFYNYKIFQ